MKFIREQIRFLRKINFLLNSKEKNDLLLWFVCKTLLMFLDFGAIGLLGLTTSAFIPIVQSREQPLPRILDPLYSVFETKLSLNEFLFLLLGIVSTILITRSILSLTVDRYFFKRMTLISQRLSSEILKSHLRRTIEKRKKISLEELVFTVKDSINSLATYALSSIVTIMAESVILFAFMIILFTFSPYVFVGVFIMLGGGIAHFVGRHLIKSRGFDKKYVECEIRTEFELRKLSLLSNELRLRNKLSSSIDGFVGEFSRLIDLNGLRQVQFSVPRIILEVTLVSGGIVGGFLLWYFETSQKALVALVIYLIIGFRVLPSVNKIMNSMLLIVRHQEHAKKFFNLFDFYADEVVESGVVSRKRNNESLGLRLENVTYSFGSGGAKELKFSLHFPTKGLYVIKGRNGSGKTTLLELIAGFRESRTGTIYIDDLDIAEIEDHQREQFVAMCPQEPQLFAESWGDSLFLEESDPKYFEKANLAINLISKLKLNHLVTVNDPSELFNLIIDPRLSDGEKQKIGLIRTLLLDPRVMLFDEPTSNLDGVSVKSFLEVIEEEVKHRIVVVATHDKVFDGVASNRKKVIL